MSIRRAIGFAIACCCLVFPWAGGPPARAAEPLLVFAAASLSEVLTEVGAAYAATGKPAPVFSFAASSTLARQIENGAPAALFVSADEQWMDYLAERKLVAPDTRAVLATNRLILIVPSDRPRWIEIGPGFALAQLLNGGKLAVGDPDAVPAGRYARAALETFGVWREVERSIVRADNVRAALAFVERGAAAAGIVYATDAASAKSVATAGIFPATSHPSITYPVAVVAARDSEDARAFLGFARAPHAQSILAAFGFGAPAAR